MIANKDGGVSSRAAGLFAQRSGTSSPLSQDPLSEAVDSTSRWLIDGQKPEGFWVGELEGDTILESEYVLLMAFIGRGAEEVCVKACRYLRDLQLPGGGWAIYPGGPPDISASVKAYFALKIVGVPVNDPAMIRARECILEAGGAQGCNSFTRFYLALLGQIGYGDCPSVPPEMMLVPSRLGFSLAAMSAWTRTIVVPLSIMSAFKPVRRLAPEQGIAELFRTDLPLHPARRTKQLVSWTNVFLGLDRVFKWADRTLPLSWRRPGIRAAHRWMLDHFENSDGLGAIFPPMIYTVVALHCLGYEPDSAEVQWAHRQLDDLLIEEDGKVRVQPCVSPVWDTAIAAIALADAKVPDYHPALLRAGRWLLEKEVRVAGDWQVRRPGVEPSGWHFQFHNERYPDIDDTAMVILALQRTALAKTPEAKAATDRGVKWLLSMQNRDGGWAAFDVDIDNEVLTKVPFADHNAMLDPSCADITARILECLGALGYRNDHPAVARALDYLWKTQEPQGCWYGRWGVNYIYGTWQVLQGLKALDFPMDHPALQKAADWLESVQQADGGWGESCQSYDDPSWMGRGEPTASQTAWALLGLVSAGRGRGEAATRGAEYLRTTQRPDGTWDEGPYTGTGFPRVFYLKYHLYRIYFPLMAISRYQDAAGRVPVTTTTPGAQASRIPALPKPFAV
ncbi:squalene--hopene cyclase [Singulisphaera sp. Ch08]|uniref:Squalene--hopene cyclase n=1 Tax=Singulisphaera sp. Ch08 TaxID=3120278 RepID=A0AAU7CC63_9BACT